MLPKLDPIRRIELFNEIKKGGIVTEICKKYGISRALYYRWKKRYKENEKLLNPKSHGRPRKIEIKKETAYRKLLLSEKIEMVKDVLERGVSVDSISEKYNISRTTVYKWINRYKKASNIEKTSSLRRKEKKIDRYWNQTPEKYEKAVLSLVEKHPEYGVRKIVKNLPQIAGSPILSHKGVQNVLRRHDLSIYEQREAYAKAKITPVRRLVTETLGLAESFAGIEKNLRGRIVKTSGAFIISAFITVFVFGLGSFYVRSASDVPGASSLGMFLATVALLMGSAFFLYSFKYYSTLALVLSFSQKEGLGYVNGNSKRKGFLPWLLGYGNGNGKAERTGPVGLEPSMEHVSLKRYPFISIQIPLYNEKRVVERITAAVTNFDYEGDYEVILCDDSTDETTSIIRNYQKQYLKEGQELAITKNEEKGWELSEVKVRSGVVLKHLHRTSRSGFKGGALNLALTLCDPRTEFVSIFDADFVPYPDTLDLFLKYFKAKNDMSEDYSKGNIAAVCGYQWHVLNKSENWITRGIRTEYAGSYVIERSGTEIYNGLKLIHGSVYAIRKDVLEDVGWGTSITEDFELTLKLYEKGYKVVYTPYIQAPAECVSTIKRLIRQRMRWAEGHSFNVKKMFFKIMLNPKISSAEKFEFTYLTPYYLQAFLFLVGSLSWILSETVFPARLPFWTSLWGWSLVLTNLIALPLMNAVGLFLEESEEKDYMGLFSFLALSYILVPFQAYASLKGFLEKEEGGWFRTPKTGRITDVFKRGTFFRFISGILPGRARPAVQGLSDFSVNPGVLALSTANSRFNSFDIKPKKKAGWAGKVVISVLLALTTTIYSMSHKIAEVEASIVNNFYLAASSVDEDSANVSTLYNGGFWNKQGSAVGSTDTVLQGTNTTFWWYSREYPTGNDNAVISAGSYVFNPYKIAAGTGAPAVFIYTPEVGYCTGGCDEAGDYTMIVTGSQQTWARNTAAGLRSVTIGNGGSVAFNVHNKGRLYLKLTVTTNDTTYGMGYNGSSGNYITNLQTPNLTIPENIFLLLLVVPFIPFLVKYSKRKGRHYSVSF